MARHPNPIEQQKLSGADKRNPQLYKKEVPKSESVLGQYPSEASTAPEDCWFELSSYTLPGVMTGADRFMLEMASDLLAEYRSNRTGFAVGKYTHLISLLARFGMSPSDRTKLGVDKSQKENYFAKLDD